MNPRVVEDHARIARRRGDGLDATLLRTKSLAGREVMAHLVSRGEADVEAIVDRIRAEGPSAIQGWRRAWLPRLARILALSRLRPEDLEDAVAIFDVMLEGGVAAAIEPREAIVFLDALYTLGRHDDVLRLLEILRLDDRHRNRLWVDLQNPYVAARTDREHPAEGWWLAGLAACMNLGPGPVEPITLSHPARGTVPFDRLHAEPLRLIQGPLVSVLVTAYNPGTPLLTAIRSLANQTWDNLEILVIDDASVPDTRHFFDTATELDPRVRVVRLDTNRGTYHARNVGMALALGEYVTFHDSDDWAHPRRIEELATILEENTDLVAARGSCIRVSPDLEMTFLGYEHLRPNASSLMIRREPVLARIGFMDGARKAADSEYHRRIEAAFGKGTIADIRTTAHSIVRLEPQSLSRPEFSPGWQHPARRSYKGFYERFHKRVRAGVDPFLALDAERRFPMPRRFERIHELVHFDAVFVGDWREYGGPQRSMLAEIAALRTKGLRIGIGHLEAFRFMRHRNPPLCDPVLRKIEAGEVEPVLLDDPTSMDLLVIRYPPVLQFPPIGRADWEVGRIWLVANQTPSEPDGSDARYDAADCTNACTTLFGDRPTWVPQGPNVRKVLDALNGIEVAAFDDPAIIERSAWFRPHTPSPAEIRIGRYSRDNPIKFPDSVDDLLQAYPDAPGVSVSIMGGGRKSIPALLDGRPTPLNWHLIPFEGMKPEEFLQSIDFFVYFDNPNAHEAFGRSILEAVASGVVVVLPEKHRETFGDAAIYCEPAEVLGVVRALAGDPDAYRTQVSTASAVVDERFSPDAFVRRAAPFLSALTS